MARRIARPIHLVASWLLVIGLLVQVFLAGMGVFAGASNFATHRDFGYALTLLPSQATTAVSNFALKCAQPSPPFFST